MIYKIMKDGNKYLTKLIYNCGYNKVQRTELS